MTEYDYSMSPEVKPVDVQQYIETGEDAAACKAVAESFKNFGICIIKDPRVPFEKNNTFIDTMERYFDLPEGEKMSQTRPDLAYQVGPTPGGVEKARNHCSKVAKFDPRDQPLTLCPPEADPKWRFFWRLNKKGKDGQAADYGKLHAENVIPDNFPEWEQVMDGWGYPMVGACETLAEMAAIGFGLPKDEFTKRMKNGPHLLAPTGSDLNKHGKTGTVFAGYHYDLNFITIHGKSRYPGLFVWLRDGRKMKVSMPDGCLLAQAAIQFEYLTGGHVFAGFHEVVVTEDTQKAILRQKEAGAPLWRVSSTVFSHINSQQILQPVGHFANEETNAKYPPIKTGDQVMKELEHIKLAADNH